MNVAWLASHPHPNRQKARLLQDALIMKERERERERWEERRDVRRVLTESFTQVKAKEQTTEVR